jgi:rubrerythrin
MQSLAAYEARMDDPEYGRVFERLAQQERAHCQWLLTLIGSLRNK